MYSNENLANKIIGLVCMNDRFTFQSLEFKIPKYRVNVHICSFAC